MRPPVHLRFLYLLGVRPSVRWLPWTEAIIRSPQWPFVVGARWLTILTVAVGLEVLLLFFFGPPNEPGEAAVSMVLVAMCLVATPLVAARADTAEAREWELERIRRVVGWEQLRVSFACATVAWVFLSAAAGVSWFPILCGFVLIKLLETRVKRHRRAA